MDDHKGTAVLELGVSDACSTSSARPKKKKPRVLPPSAFDTFDWREVELEEAHLISQFSADRVDEFCDVDNS